MFTVTTTNLGPKRVTPEEVDADLDLLESLSLVVAVQEAGRRVRRALLRGRRRGRRGRHPGPAARAGKQATTILWDARRLEAVRRRSRRLNRPTWVGNEGAGGPIAVSRFVNHVTLRDRETGTLTDVLNAHLIPSTTRPGMSRAARRRRRRVYIRQVGQLERELDTIPRGRRAILLMDANAQPSYRLLNPLRRAGFRPAAAPPSHGRRRIDHAWIRDVRPAASPLATPTHSDHVALTFRLRP